MASCQGQQANTGRCRASRLMIDTHCHLDQIDSPESIVEGCRAKGMQVVAVTNLPSHYALSLPHLKDSPLIKPALGLHPLLAAANQHELMPFVRLANGAEYIGEIGLDFSPKGAPTRDAQVAAFERILDALKGCRRFITVHSRGAVIPVLNLLQRKGVGPVVFHWFTGSSSELGRVIDAGHYLSINPSMLGTATGRRVIEATPEDRILTETDAPFARIKGRTTLPWDVDAVLSHLVVEWKKDCGEVERAIAENFTRLISPIL